MSDLIKTPKGYIRAGEIQRFYVRHSPGWDDNQQIVVVMRATAGDPPEHFVTGMYEIDFLAAYEAALD